MGVVSLATHLGEEQSIVPIPTSALGHHTLIVGQSGSGKSFMLARLLEEILLRTSARVVIFDPNGDFDRFDEHVTSAWSDPRLARALSDAAAAWRRFHNSGSHQTVGREVEVLDTQEAFETRWTERSVCSLRLSGRAVSSGEGARRASPRSHFAQLKFDWSTLDEFRDWLFEIRGKPSHAARLGLLACTAYADFEATRAWSRPRDNLDGLIEICQEFAQQDIALKHYQYLKRLSDDDWKEVRAILESVRRHHSALFSRSPATIDSDPSQYLRAMCNGAVDDRSAPDVLHLGLEQARPDDALVAAELVLGTLWNLMKARKIRSSDRLEPVFVVFDECQIFAPDAPKQPLEARLCERLVQIASEGRKYGIYLVLATQRPTKLEPRLVAECENQCILRLQGHAEHAFATNVLGIDERRAKQIQDFRLGHALLAGQWVGGVEAPVRIVPARVELGGGGGGGVWAAPREDRVSWSLLLPSAAMRLERASVSPDDSGHLQGDESLAMLFGELGVPYLSMQQFRELFDVMSMETTKSIRTFYSFTKDIKTELAARGHSVPRNTINFVAKGISFQGVRFDEGGAYTAEQLASHFGRQLQFLLEQRDISLNDATLAALLRHVCADESPPGELSEGAEAGESALLGDPLDTAGSEPAKEFIESEAAEHDDPLDKDAQTS